jgi:polar amino acid transport system substrate-binding protein
MHLNRSSAVKRRYLLTAATATAISSVLLGGCGEAAPRAGTAAANGDASASSDDSSLAAIQSRKELRVGSYYSFPNWGFLDDKRQPAGFDIDMAKAMAKALGVKLTLVETDLNNRVPYLQSQRVDVVLGVFSVTPERAKAVDFSDPYGALVAQLISPKGDGINGPADLSGKTVAVTKGNTSTDAIKAVAPKDAKFLQFEGTADTFLALKQGKVDAAVQGLTGVNTFIKDNPKFERKGAPIEPYSMISAGVRKGNSTLLSWTNDWLATMESSGETARLYKQWFEIDRPPLS